jgi:DNA polymerase delta subunit 2
MAQWVAPSLCALTEDIDQSTYVAFASGLNISGEMHESLETHLMVEYLTGELLCTEVVTLAVKLTR